MCNCQILKDQSTEDKGGKRYRTWIKNSRKADNNPINGCWLMKTWWKAQIKMQSISEMDTETIYQGKHENTSTNTPKKCKNKCKNTKPMRQTKCKERVVGNMERNMIIENAPYVETYIITVTRKKIILPKVFRGQIKEKCTILRERHWDLHVYDINLVLNSKKNLFKELILAPVTKWNCNQVKAS